MMLSDEPENILRADAIRYLLRRFEMNSGESIHRQEIVDYLHRAVSGR